MSRSPFLPLLLLASLLALVATSKAQPSTPPVLVPQIDGPWIPIAGNPDLGKLSSDEQQPVDFGVWQAGDGTWQLWSCIRKTKTGGKTRLFHRWEGESITAPNWKPMGIAMEADTELGETEGGMQAPHVIRIGDTWHMFYGDWEHICHATSKDGKHFTRVVQPNGKTGLFKEVEGSNTRDIMMLRIGKVWHGYYTAHPHEQGVVFVRTTEDFKNWSKGLAVAAGGVAGNQYWSAECPHVVEKSGAYYLFRTQNYGEDNITRIYRSTDPTYFGINQDHDYLVAELPVAAPEMVTLDGQDYLVALNPGLDGIRVAKLKWAQAEDS